MTDSKPDTPDLGREDSARESAEDARRHPTETVEALEHRIGANSVPDLRSADIRSGEDVTIEENSEADEGGSSGSTTVNEPPE